MNPFLHIYTCGECDFYNDAATIVVKIPNAGECFLGKLERFDNGKQSRLTRKLVGKAKEPCEYFVVSSDDEQFLVET